MKKEGFTLVELLAVIVIIGIIYLIVFPSVTSFIDKSKEKSYNIQVDLIEKASKKSLQNVDSNFANSKDKKIDTDEFIKSMEQEGYKCKK